MSRIDEALKRARSARVPEHDAVDSRPFELHAVETPIVPSWHLDRLPSEGVTERRAADRVEPSVRETRRAPSVLSATQVAATAATPLAIRYKSDGLSREFSEKLVVTAQSTEGTAEQYRRVAASLHQAQKQQRIKIVMIASAMPAEGKTLTAANVALTLSESYGRRVLLVDADLRRPALHQVFQVSNALGLADGLEAEADRPLPLIEFSPLLSVLPAGKPQADPMRLLVSGAMRRVLAEAGEAFDWVIVDTPPLGIVSDAHLLAEMVDKVVLVVRATVTPYDQVTAATNRLGREKIMGVVLNGVTEQDVTHAYEQYGYGHSQK